MKNLFLIFCWVILGLVIMGWYAGTLFMLSTKKIDTIMMVILWVPGVFMIMAWVEMTKKLFKKS